MTTSEYEPANAEQDMPNSDPNDPDSDAKKYTWSDVQTYGELYATRKVSEWAQKSGLAEMRLQSEKAKKEAAEAEADYKAFCDDLARDVNILEDIVVNIPPIPETDAEMEALIKPIEGE